MQTRGGGRVLMLAHHFPPMGGSGSNRALAFARYLPASGWQPTVITPDMAYAANRDDGLLAELPESVRVVRTRSWENQPGQLVPSASASASGNDRKRRDGQTVTSAARRHLGHLKRFPDAHLGWLPFALGAARRQRFEVAYSSSGPFTTHLLGLLLKKTSHRPWVAELRDGWYRWNRAIFPDYPAWRDALEQRLEAAAIRTADRVVLVTDRMAEAFRAQYAELPRGHFRVIPNGFDPIQFENATLPQEAEAHSGWHLLHAGALYYGRSVSALLQAIRQLAGAEGDFGRDIRLTLLGTLDTGAQREVQRSGLASRVHVVAQTDHAAAIAAMRCADALLLIANTTPGAEATVPGKVFEYLAVGRPILAIAPPESSTADVLHSTGGGWLAASGSVDSIVCALKDAYTRRDLRPDPTEVARFDRRRLAANLAQLFDEVTGCAARRI